MLGSSDAEGEWLAGAGWQCGAGEAGAGSAPNEADAASHANIPDPSHSPTLRARLAWRPRSKRSSTSSGVAPAHVASYRASLLQKSLEMHRGVRAAIRLPSCLLQVILQVGKLLHCAKLLRGNERL